MQKKYYVFHILFHISLMENWENKLAALTNTH